MNYVEVGWRLAVVLGTALRDGIVESVSSGSRTPAEVAAELGMDERAVFTVMSALDEAGILDASSGRFVLREEHRGPLLDLEHPQYAGGRVIHNFETIAKWTTLPNILKTGRPAEDRTVPEFDGTETMARAMRAGSRESADEVSEFLVPRLSESPRILDIGGGSGANSESFARRGAEVTILDRAEVFAVNGAYFEAAGITAIPGDLNDSLPAGPFDCAYLGNTSHMYGELENRDLLRKMHDVLVPGGCAVLREFVREAEGDVPGEAAMFAVNMLVLTSRGATYTVEEYEKWFIEAGFEQIEFHPIPGRTTTLVIARRPERLA